MRGLFIAIQALFGASCLPVGGQDTAALEFRIDADKVVRRDADKVLGINLNFVRDLDANRPQARPLAAALREMRVHWLRFPGGEKSNFHLWARPHYEKPDPVFLDGYGRYPGTLMDFDQYMEVVREVGAEPYVVVGYRVGEGSEIPRSQWIESAAAWVRYANVVKKYGVRYWEIGNENWGETKGYDAATVAAHVVEFSRAMKAVDPTIKVGASGTASWWERFLPAAIGHIDFINLSMYNCFGWKSYDRFLRNPDLTPDVREAVRALRRDVSEEQRRRLQIIVSEYNSTDGTKDGWPYSNSWGHALVTFCTLGWLLIQDETAAVMVWTTRWMYDEQAKHCQWYALGPDNELLATGQAIALWGRYLHSDMLAVEGDAPLVSTFASATRDRKKMTIWILNRSYSAARIGKIEITQAHRYRQAERRCLSGSSPDDSAPAWSEGTAPPLDRHGLGQIECPPLSVTVISLKE